MVKRLKLYRTLNGRAPFQEWLDDLKDVRGRARIRMRLKRAMQGNFGDHRPIGAGIIELRVHEGPGYRIYLGLHGEEIVVLLCGGDKSTQDRDIEKAYLYWDDYERRL